MKNRKKSQTPDSQLTEESILRMKRNIDTLDRIIERLQQMAMPNERPGSP